MKLRSSTKYIVVHCSATPPDMDIGAETIRKWHTRDNGWRDIGYHLVIRRDGAIEAGRHLEDTGAHTRGHNHESLGVCLVGGVDKDGKPDDNFTGSQKDALAYDVFNFLNAMYPEAKWRGHRDFNPGKACPSFDVVEFLSTYPVEKKDTYPREPRPSVENLYQQYVRLCELAKTHPYESTSRLWHSNHDFLLSYDRLTNNNEWMETIRNEQ